jgi:hypothetical protein
LRHIAVSCLVAFLLACTTSSAPGTGITDDACEPIVVVPGPDTSPDERAAVAAGIALWKQRGVSPFTLDDVAGAPRIPLTFQDAAAIFHGYYDPAGGQVFINRALTDPHQRAVTIAHELGHALGLPHISDRSSVMTKANLVVEPTEADALAVRDLWGDCGGN